MRKIIITILCGSLLFLAACGSEKNEITVKYDGQEKTFEPKTAFALQNDLTMSGEKAFSTQIHLANYEVDRSKGTFSIEQSIKSPEEVRVMIFLYGEKGTDKNSKLRVGEYITKSASDPFDRIANGFVNFYKDEKEKKVVMNMGNDWKGKVNITSVSDNSVFGSVDLTGKDNTSIKGTFTAELIRK